MIIHSYLFKISLSTQTSYASNLTSLSQYLLTCFSSFYVQHAQSFRCIFHFSHKSTLLFIRFRIYASVYKW